MNNILIRIHTSFQLKMDNIQITQFTQVLLFLKGSCEAKTMEMKLINKQIHTQTHTLIYIQIGMYTIYWLLTG